MLRYRYLLLASAVVHVAMADDHDDYHSPNTCLTPGRCDSSTLRASDAATQAGIRVVQLLSGRDHAVPSTATSGAQRQLFEQAKSMVNYQYLVGDLASNEVVVVDGAWDPEGIRRFVRDAGLKLVGYVATHFHYDHIGSVAGHGSPPARDTIPGIKQFVEEFGLPAYIHSTELQHALDWSDIKNRSSMHGIEQGHVLQLGSVSMQFLHTPGHSPGGMSLVLAVNGNDEMVITGDTLFPGSCGRVDLPGSDKKAMHKSLQNVLAKLPEHLVVWPGHGYSSSSSTIGREKSSGLLRPISEQQWLRMMG